MFLETADSRNKLRHDKVRFVKINDFFLKQMKFQRDSGKIYTEAWNKIQIGTQFKLEHNSNFVSLVFAADGQKIK
jgi:hypothetical protein